MARTAVPLLLAAILLLAACGESSPPRASVPPNQPPSITIGLPALAHEGYETAITVGVHDPDSVLWSASLDWGDGSPLTIIGPDAGARIITLTHRYLGDGPQRVSVLASDSQGGWSTAAATIEVWPRRLLVVQGVGSRSSCGRGFGDGPTRWIGPVPEGVAARSPIEVTARDLLHFSYSGRYCDGDGTAGELADYSTDEACGSIDGSQGSAARLRALIDSVAPARVTVVAHSMGGLVAAYLAGSDPDWAREHIASVVTFDSPLRGVPQLNLAALRVGGPCSFNSGAIGDLSDRNEDLLRTAGRAALAVPFYNLDATDREGPLAGLRQAVPSSRTHLEGEAGHWAVGLNHDAIWDHGPQGREGEVIRQVVNCALALTPGPDCTT